MVWDRNSQIQFNSDDNRILTRRDMMDRAAVRTHASLNGLMEASCLNELPDSRGCLAFKGYSRLLSPLVFLVMFLCLTLDENFACHAGRLCNRKSVCVRTFSRAALFIDVMALQLATLKTVKISQF